MSVATVEIRPMTATDLDRVIEIAESLPQAPHWPCSAWQDALNPDATPRRIALVAEAPQTGIMQTGSSILGFAVASLLPPQAELETIAVAPHSQRQGIAQQLFAALSGQLRAVAITEVTLEVRASNQPALALYCSLGFVEAGRRPRYYTDPVEDAVLLFLPLA